MIPGRTRTHPVSPGKPPRHQHAPGSSTRLAPAAAASLLTAFFQTSAFISAEGEQRPGRTGLTGSGDSTALSLACAQRWPGKTSAGAFYPTEQVGRRPRPLLQGAGPMAASTGTWVTPAQGVTPGPAPSSWMSLAVGFSLLVFQERKGVVGQPAGRGRARAAR